MRRNENKFLLLILVTVLIVTVGLAFTQSNKYVIVNVTRRGLPQEDLKVWVSYYDKVKRVNVSGSGTTWSDGETLEIPIPNYVNKIYIQVSGLNYSATIGNFSVTTVYIELPNN